jgi:Uma2 family endonuclease
LRTLRAGHASRAAARRFHSHVLRSGVKARRAKRAKAPEAVIEVISKGYEYKDLEIGPNFYLAQGVKDVVVFNPYTLVVLHVRRDGARHGVSPMEIGLECGCRVVV